jgi:hypothetical protein
MTILSPATQNSVKTIRFIRRGEIVSVKYVPPSRTLLELLREDLGRTGSKEGCGEGDCGACTVVLGEAQGGAMTYRAVNSCIRLAHSIDGMVLWTVEDIAPTLPTACGSLPPEGAECRGSEPAGAGLDGTKSGGVSQSCGLQGLRLRPGEAGSAAPAGEEGAPALAVRDLKRWQARVLVAMTFAGWVALIAGWYVTEIGRQPWLVSGVLTAADAASKVVAPKIAVTLALYLTLYAALIAAYISVVFYLARNGNHGSHADQPLAGDQPASLNVVNHPKKQGAAHA